MIFNLYELYKPRTRTDRLALRRCREIFALRDPEGGVLEGPSYLYRPRQVLVLNEIAERVAGELREEGGHRDEEDEELDRIGLQRWYLPDRVSVPELVPRLRRDLGDQAYGVAPNNVLVGEPVYHGGPGGEPRPAASFEFPSTKAATPVRVDVLDTGVVADIGDLHPDLGAALVHVEQTDTDLLDIDGDDILDLQAGHGTFVTGIVRRCLASVQVEPEAVLSPRGIGDDRSVALGLSKVLG
jgi:hypothetical protein